MPSANAFHAANTEAKRKSLYQEIIIEIEMEIHKKSLKENSVLYKNLYAVYAVELPNFLEMPCLTEMIRLANLLVSVLNREMEFFGRIWATNKCVCSEGMPKLTHEYKSAFTESYKLLCGVVLALLLLLEKICFLAHNEY